MDVQQSTGTFSAYSTAAVIRALQPRTYILVADGAEAHLLGTRGRRAAFTTIARFEEPRARRPGRALISDRTGRVFNSVGRVPQGPPSRARHGAQSDYDPHAVETERFAKRLVRTLEAARCDRHFEQLILIADPKFLGVLRAQLPLPLRRTVTREVARNLVRAPELAIRRAAFAREAG